MTLRNGQSIDDRSIEVLDEPAFRLGILRQVGDGRRLVSLFGRELPHGGVRLHAFVADDAKGRLDVLATDVADGYDALTPDCTQAHYFERELFEQHGVRPQGHPWLKPVRDHGVEHPCFRVEGDEVHEVAVGPVHAGIIDPGHFRFQCHGEAVLNLEIQLGYQHRGVEKALEGGPDKRSALLAESLAGDTTIGHALAHAEVIEALAGCQVSPRAHALRAVALELERISNHVGDLGALGADIGFLPTSAYFGRLRGEFLNMLMTLTGSRYGRGFVRPGGVVLDLSAEMAGELQRRLLQAVADLDQIAGLFFETPSVRSRLEGTGTITLRACEDLGLLGPVARACGSGRDVRRDHPTGSYTSTRFPVATSQTGDVFARAQVRRLEAQWSVGFLLSLIRSMPEGGLLAPCGPLPPHSVAVSMVEGWRGEIVHVVVTDGRGRFARYKVKDPSFQNWTGLALALRNVAISDFPLCNKSFNLSYAGHDL